jgi:transcriptional regulator GlxA family with amidase domain
VLAVKLARSAVAKDEQMRERSAAATFGIVVYEGVEPIDIGGTAGVISMARRVLPRIEATLVATQVCPVALAGGVSILAHKSFAEAQQFDQVIICGGPGWEAASQDGALRAFLQRQPARSIASVCTGALILAAVGLLDGRTATTRRRATGAEDRSPLERLPEMGRDIQAREALVVDAGVVTGGGVSLAIDTTLYLIGRLYGEDARDEVARVIEYDRAWRANCAALGLACVADVL